MKARHVTAASISGSPADPTAESQRSSRGHDEHAVSASNKFRVVCFYRDNPEIKESDNVDSVERLL